MKFSGASCQTESRPVEGGDNLAKFQKDSQEAPQKTEAGLSSVDKFFRLCNFLAGASILFLMG